MKPDKRSNGVPSNFPLKREKRNVYIGGRRTTLSFEIYVWEALEELSRYESQSVDAICSEIVDNYRGDENISTVIRYLALEATRIRVMAELQALSGGDFHENVMPFPSPLYAAMAKLNTPYLASNDAKPLPSEKRNPSHR
ncbi:ribbon-helix-helix domain-containing protein [Alphaproteobacteria bacterium LSUCC0684]